MSSVRACLFFRLTLVICIISLNLVLLRSNSTKYSPVDFDVYMIGDGAGKTFLLLGGIQGDEPGGFNAINVLFMNYKITNGSVILVPASNKVSMFLNHRGIHGDMNRKFSYLDSKDQDYHLIRKLKHLITLDKVSLILHLHDGSGFWRPTFISSKLNPNRWGNCSIIDQDNLPGVEHGDLISIVNGMVDYINLGLLDPSHKYHVKNTHTSKRSDTEMLKALTYYAIKNNKPAFANEASKELSLSGRVYYHLRAIEYMLGLLGIHFERDFDLTLKGVHDVIYNKNLLASTYAVELDSSRVNIFDSTGAGLNDDYVNYVDHKLGYESKLYLTVPLFGLRSTLRNIYMPHPGTLTLDTLSKSVITGFLNKGGLTYLKYGNRVLSKFIPTYVEYDTDPAQIHLDVDGHVSKFKSGSIVDVKKRFRVYKSDYKVVIDGLSSSSEYMTENSFSRDYSMDNLGKIYKIDLFRQDGHHGVSDSLLSAVVRVNIANVRTSPNTQSMIVAKSPRSRRVNVLYIRDGWARIFYIYKGREIKGYIFSDLLDIVGHAKGSVVYSGSLTIRFR